MKRFATTCLASVAMALAWSPAVHAQGDVFTIKIKDHRFDPDTIEIPSDKKVKLIIINQDKTAEEFESDDLRREKMIPAGKEVTVLIGPLRPGTYKFVGEYNPSTARGVVVVK